MKHIFREYDIRGIYDKDLNEDVVKKIGYFLGKKIKKKYVFVSYDARVHSITLHNYLVSGLNKAGKKVISGGMLPTGANYFANFINLCINGKIKIGGSIQITGSHNPPEYNGFKITIDKLPFYGEDIYKLADEVLNSDIKIEDNFEVIEYDLKSGYVDYISNQFSHLKGLNLDGVFDVGNGVAGVVLRDILEKIGIKNYEILFEEPDGNFPNHHPDPTEEENLKDIYEKLKTRKFAFAFDGDADRIAFLDKKYNYKGDILAYFFAKNMNNPCVISEVKASQIMYDEINKFGKAIMYKTGHSNLKTLLKEKKNCDLAAEVSGHIFFNDRYFGIDDAIYVAFRIMELIDKGFDFQKEFEALPKVYNTDEIKVKTTEDKKFEIIKNLKEYLEKNKENLKIKEIITVDGVRVVFENGWGLIRASNTTPVLVTRFEANSKENLEKIKNRLTTILDNFL